MTKSRKTGVKSLESMELALAKVIVLEIMKGIKEQISDQAPEKVSSYLLKKLNNIVTEITREEERQSLAFVDNLIELWEGLS